MPGLPVIADGALDPGLLPEFVKTYQVKTRNLNAKLGGIMRLDVPSDKITEKYVYPESSPIPRRWPRGENVPSMNFKFVQFSVTNVDWAISVPWFYNDLSDDQSKALMSTVRGVAERFVQLTERVFFQYVTGGSDPALLAALANAPDGAALFAATDGASANRFGISGGNLLASGVLSGVASGKAVRTDRFKSRNARFARFQDTVSQPLAEAYLDDGEIAFFAPDLEEQFLEAFSQNPTAGNTSGEGSVQNVIKTAPTLVPTQRITGNAWFHGLTGMEQKALMQQNREPMKTLEARRENSDSARRTKIEEMQFESRFTIAALLPFMFNKLNNT